MYAMPSGVGLQAPCNEPRLVHSGPARLTRMHVLTRARWLERCCCHTLMTPALRRGEPEWALRKTVATFAYGVPVRLVRPLRARLHGAVWQVACRSCVVPRQGRHGPSNNACGTAQRRLHPSWSLLISAPCFTPTFSNSASKFAVRDTTCATCISVPSYSCNQVQLSAGGTGTAQPCSRTKSAPYKHGLYGS